MSRETLAPKLRRFMVEASLPIGPSGAWTDESKELWGGADRERRALLSVARAAERWGDAPYCGDLSGVTAEHSALARAVRRLRRVSGSGGPRKGKRRG